MLNFDLHIPTKIIFGRKAQEQIGKALKPYAGKVLLHYGGGSIKKSGLYSEITAALRGSGIAFAELGGVVPNPRLGLVQKGIELCRKEQVELVLAVGGGSVIDSAKAIAMGFYYEGNIWDVYETGQAITAALPVAAVLTIPAAGSESSPNTVITNEEKAIKRGFGSQLLRPVLSVVNPELFFTLPQEQLANGAADMMSHIFERYFTNTTHTDLTDSLCEATLKTIMKNALLVKADRQDYDAWSEIGLGATFAHNNILGVGREQDWACHGMEHELSAIYDVAHGAGLAVLTPNWMEYVYKDNIAIFTQFAVKVMGVEGGYRPAEAPILAAIAKLRKFYRELGLPSTLKELGIDESKLELMAQKATGAAYGAERPLGNFKKLLWQDVLAIYKRSA
ncbi:MAG: iron-containing alcohol dehydrogenase [Acidaminococcales bacterium]|jgi:alcohol dehydrogenase YqhD (iron-dependent ADH family)|nr:iron-containing alcohol dehydrogenase [Acidaminococcales bacterium]